MTSQLKLGKKSKISVATDRNPEFPASSQDEALFPWSDSRRNPLKTHKESDSLSTTQEVPESFNIIGEKPRVSNNSKKARVPKLIAR